MKIKTMVTESLYSNNVVKLTDAQWRLYYYFLSICEDNFICKQNLKIKHCCEILNLTKSTYYNAIKALLKYNLITDYNDSIVINKSTDDFVDIEMSVLKVLLHFSKTADLIRLYLMFLKFGNTKIKYPKINIIIVSYTKLIFSPLLFIYYIIIIFYLIYYIEYRYCNSYYYYYCYYHMKVNNC